jgi:hypothetical protein
MLSEPTHQQTLEIFDIYPRRQRRTPQMLQRKLKEVIFGKRKALRVYSQTLKTNIWFVNEGLINPSEKNFDGAVITMERLAEVLADGHPPSQLANDILET